MKLRNKRTGEVFEMYSEAVNLGDASQIILFPRGQIQKNKQAYHYNSLAKLTEEWEDYEEPKEFWMINDIGEVVRMTELDDEIDQLSKDIGDYFETKEEAEQAVEKLKAWKRLKDKGFKFNGYDVAHNGAGDLCGQVFYNAGKCSIECVEKDLDLLFGGENE